VASGERIGGCHPRKSEKVRCVGLGNIDINHIAVVEYFVEVEISATDAKYMSRSVID
jgi:hypothetical protein